MMYWIALAAALGCALCNGIATVLQKEGADRQKRATSLDARLLLRLIRDWRYNLGIVLDLTGGGLTLVAVHTLPLFLVQSLIASSVAVTLLVERYILHRATLRRSYAAIIMVLVGLVMVAYTAAPERALPVSAGTEWAILLAIVPLAIIGAISSGTQRVGSTTILAISSGIAFGLTSVAGRILTVPTPFWHLIYNPVLYAFGLYGVLGLWLFTIGLQRASATVLNTVMTAIQTLVPAGLGIVFLGDSVRHGQWDIALSGMILALLGSVIIATVRQQPSKSKPKRRKRHR